MIVLSDKLKPQQSPTTATTYHVPMLLIRIYSGGANSLVEEEAHESFHLLAFEYIFSSDHHTACAGIFQRVGCIRLLLNYYNSLASVQSLSLQTLLFSPRLLWRPLARVRMVCFSAERLHTPRGCEGRIVLPGGLWRRPVQQGSSARPRKPRLLFTGHPRQGLYAGHKQSYSD
jgi:hypothetical protein